MKKAKQKSGIKEREKKPLTTMWYLHGGEYQMKWVKRLWCKHDGTITSWHNQMEGVVKEKTDRHPWIVSYEKRLIFSSTIPKEFCSRWAELQDSANQTLTLIKRWRGTGEVEFTVRWTKNPHAAVRKREHIQYFGWVQNGNRCGQICKTWESF